MTWKAIVVGRKALDVGLIDWVGDGTTISTWSDNWILNTASLKPMGRIGTAPLEKVSDVIDTAPLEKLLDVIDSYTGKWNVDIVRANFFGTECGGDLKYTFKSRRW
jgi:hypothetical protein